MSILLLIAITQAALAISLQLFGLWYADRITKHPFERTWASVVFGAGLTLLFANLSFVVFLVYLNLLHLWWLAVPLNAGFAISGWPMILNQESKLQNQIKKSWLADKKFNGDL
jgi:hypothetical protein